jgi:hypothetical protein
MFTIRSVAALGSILLLTSVCVVGAGLPLEEMNLRKSVGVHTSLSKQDFILGEPIAIDLTITNNGTSKLHMIDPSRSPFEASFQDDSVQIGRQEMSAWASGLAPAFSLEPGEGRTSSLFARFQPRIGSVKEVTVIFRTSLSVRDGSSANPGVSIPVSGVFKLRIHPGSRVQLTAAMERYARQLQGTDPELQSQAAYALAVADPNVAVPMLRMALQDRAQLYLGYSPHVVWALGKIGTDQATTELLDLALHNDDLTVRTGAIEQLGNWHRTSALPTLVELSSSPEAQIRLSAVTALGSIGDQSSLGALELRLTDPDEKVRSMAHRVYDHLKNTSHRDANQTNEANR